jgi:hypothetical protein
MSLAIEGGSTLTNVAGSSELSETSTGAGCALTVCGGGTKSASFAESSDACSACILSVEVLFLDTAFKRAMNSFAVYTITDYYRLQVDSLLDEQQIND